MGQLVKPVLLFWLMFSLLGCFSETESPVNPKLFRIGLPEKIDHLNVFTQTSIEFWKIQNYMYASLLRRDPHTGELLPGLAESFKYSQKKATLQFRLRPNLKWSNGDELTTADVAFTLKAHNNPDFRSIYLGIYSQLVSQVRVINKREIVFDLLKNEPSVVNALGMNLLIYPEKSYVDSRKSKQLVTSGPYQFDSFNAGQFLTLKHNSNWYGWQVEDLKNLHAFSEISFVFSHSEANLFELLNANKIDYFQSVDPQSFFRLSESLESTSDIVAVKALGYRLLGQRLVSVNHKNLALRHLEVRQALMMSYPRELVNRKIFYNLLQVANGPWSRQHPLAAEDQFNLYTFDTERANRLLEKNGWTVNSKTGIRSKKIGDNIVALSFRFSDFDKSHEPMLTLFRQYARKVGIEIKIEMTGLSDFMQRLQEGRFDLAFHQAQWVPLKPNLRFWYFSDYADDPYLNVGGFKDKVLDRYILRIEKETKASHQKKLYQKAFVRISQQLPSLYWFDDKYVFYFVRKSIHRPQDTFAYDIGLPSWSSTVNEAAN